MHQLILQVLSVFLADKLVLVLNYSHTRPIQVRRRITFSPEIKIGAQGGPLFH